MLDLSRMFGGENNFRPQQQMQDRWQGMGDRFGDMMGQGGIRDLLSNRGFDWRDRFRFGGGAKSFNDPSPPQLMDPQPQAQQMQGDPYGNPFAPSGVTLGSMLGRRPIS